MNLSLIDYVRYMINAARVICARMYDAEIPNGPRLRHCVQVYCNLSQLQSTLSYNLYVDNRQGQGSLKHVREYDE